MRLPCDHVVLGTAAADVPCETNARPWILAATILASSMAFIDGTVVNVALPALQASFHASVVDVQWIVESYGLFLSALILIGGSLGDLFGRRLVFLIGVTLFAFASLACGIASSIQALILARSIQGVGAALLVPGSLAIISASFDAKTRGSAIGTWSGYTAITTAIGPVLGGWLVEHASWRWAFFINLPIAAVVIALSLWRIPRSRSVMAAHIDWVGTLLAALGLGGLVFGFLESANLGWRNHLVFGALIIGFVCLIALILVEARAVSPMLPLALFKSRAFSGANLLTLFLYSGIGIFFFLFPMNLIQVQGYSATLAGAAVLPLILLMFLLSRWAGGLVARYGARAPLIVGPIIAALGFALLALPSIGNSYWKSFFPALLVLGFGMSTTVAPLTTVVMNAVDQDHVGSASGINNAVARVAGVLAIAVLGIVMVTAFGSRLNRRLAQISLSPEVQQALRANEVKLAGLQAPAGSPPSTETSAKEAVANSFVFGFRIITLICAALSLLSATTAFFLIPNDRPN